MSALSVISAILGWSYFLSWTVSFYPQFWVNHKRKSVTGLTIDYFAFNITGYFAYAIYTIVHYQYDTNSKVELNDVAFAFHGFLVTLLQIVQWKHFSSSSDQGIHRVNLIILIVLWVLGLYTLILAIGGYLPYYSSDSSNYSLIDMLGYSKVFISTIKYIPQAWRNYQSHSTAAWSIGAVLLDITGGVLSILQQLVDSLDSGDFHAFENFPKLLLAAVSIGFDCLFIIQHYCLYSHSNSIGNSASDGDIHIKSINHNINGSINSSSTESDAPFLIHSNAYEPADSESNSNSHNEPNASVGVARHSNNEITNDSSSLNWRGNNFNSGPAVGSVHLAIEDFRIQ